jgi:hypothetical protein
MGENHGKINKKSTRISIKSCFIHITIAKYHQIGWKYVSSMYHPCYLLGWKMRKMKREKKITKLGTNIYCWDIAQFVCFKCNN